jgi:hypothetical protein
MNPLQTIPTVYRVACAAYLPLTTNITGMASAIRTANPSGNCGTVGGGGNAPAVSFVFVLQTEPLS